MREELIILVAAALTLGMPSRSVLAVTVCKDGSCDHASIAEALYDSEHYGEDVVVHPGVYNESRLYIGGSAQGNRTLMISTEPDSPELTVIDASGSGYGVVETLFANMTIRGFTLKGGAGGVRTAYNNTVFQNMIIEDNHLDNDSGGGIRAPYGPITIIDSIIRNNTARNGAGIVCCGSENLTIVRSKFEGNEAHGIGSNSCVGGGIAMGTGLLAIEDSEIVGNRLTTHNTCRGAGISAAGEIQLTNVNIQNNVAAALGNSPGGGIYKSTPTGANPNLIINGGSISGNEGTKGGGIYLAQPSKLTLSGGSVTNNVARDGVVGSGGGIWCNSMDDIDVASATVMGNTPDEISCVPDPTLPELEVVKEMSSPISQESEGWALTQEYVLFLVKIRNVGTADATIVQMQDIVPDLFDVYQIQVTEGSATCPSEATQSVVCDVGTVAPGEQVTIWVGTTAQQAGFEQLNTATVTSENAGTHEVSVIVNTLEKDGDADGDGVSNGAEVAAGSSVFQRDWSDVSIEKIGPTRVGYGEEFQYILTVTHNGNPGGEEAESSADVIVTDSISTGLELVGASVGCDYDSAIRILTCNLGSIPIGESREINVLVRAGSLFGNIDNTANARFGTGLWDPIDSNNDSTASTAVTRSHADLSISKTGPDSARIGSVFEYKITVTNHGPDTATDVKVEDSLPDGTGFVSADPDCEYDVATRKVTCRRDSLSAGAIHRVKIRVEITSYAGESITNTATVAGNEDDYDPSNENDPQSTNQSSFSTAIGVFACKAHLFQGWFGTGILSGQGPASVARAEAASDYEDAGYEVITHIAANADDPTMKTAFKAALDDPLTCAIWVVSHGRFSPPNTYLPGLYLDDYLTSPEEVPGPWPNIQQVTFHSCGQNQQAWRSIFPNAEFISWDDGTILFLFQWDQFWRVYDPPNTSHKLAGLSGVRVNERLIHRDRFTLHGGDPVYDVNGITVPWGSFLLAPETAVELEGMTFNLIAWRDGEAINDLNARIENGSVPDSNLVLGYEASAAFDLQIDAATFVSLVSEPDEWPTAALSGGVMITRNVSGIEDGDLLDAMGRLFFGYPWMTLDLSSTFNVPESIPPEGPFTLDIEVANAGPSDAELVRVYLDSVGEAILTDTSVPCPEHPVFGGWVCELTNLNSGSSQSISLFFAGIGKDEEAVVSVDAHAPGYGEATPGDNTAVTVITGYIIFSNGFE